jgi:hypothetical protein
MTVTATGDSWLLLQNPAYGRLTFFHLLIDATIDASVGASVGAKRGCREQGDAFLWLGRRQSEPLGCTLLCSATFIFYFDLKKPNLGHK